MASDDISDREQDFFDGFESDLHEFAIGRLARAKEMCDRGELNDTYAIALCAALLRAASVAASANGLSREHVKDAIDSLYDQMETPMPPMGIA